MKRLAGTLAAAALAAPVAAQAADPPPTVTARSALVVETYTGQVAYSKAPDVKRPIASATKLMTALVALERAKAGDVLTAVRYRAGPLETVINLRPGERMTVADLVRALLLHSANDAAVTLAEGIGGSREGFVRLMNRRARELGLTNTRFANPVGLDQPGNYSTARDLVKLTLELRRFSFFRRTVNRSVVTLESGDRVRTVSNRNALVRRYPWIDGVKTGQTRGAGWVLVGSGQKRSVQVVSAVLGSSSDSARQQDTLKILNYGRKLFFVSRPVDRGDELGTVPIRYRRGAELPLVAARGYSEVIRRGSARASVSITGVPSEVEGPVRKGQRIGDVVVQRGGSVLATIPLVAKAAVPEAGVAQRTKDYFTRPFSLLLVVAVVGCSVLLLRVRRRPGSKSRQAARGRAETA